jgi:flagellin-like hook-associated protein FlgL
MTSSFFGLQTSLRGLLAQQQAIDVTGHNIANANTAGYSRQEAVLEPTRPYVIPANSASTGAGAQLGSGVDVAAIRRIRDQFLDLQYRAQQMSLGDATARTTSLDQAELAFGEPGDNGIQAQLSRFWDAWSDVANAPEDAGARAALVTTAQTLGSTFRTVSDQLSTVAQQAQDEYDAITGPSGDVANMASELANLNRSIGDAVFRGQQPNDLMDRRDQLIDRLSTLAQVSVTDTGDSRYRVDFGGVTLVDPSTPAGFTWPQTLTAPGGKLGALLDLASPSGPALTYRGQLLPARLPGVRAHDDDDGRDARHARQPHRQGRPLMSMRVTTLMSSRATLRDLNDGMERLTRLQNELSSGKQITRPSDDPYGTSRAMGLRSELGGLDQCKRNVNDGTGWLNTSDTALGQISGVLQRARELLVQGASDTAGASARAAMADEIDQLTESVKQEADVQYGGRYVFSGTATDTAPYALGGADAYAGDAGTITRAIGPQVEVPINADVHALLGDGQAAGDGRLLDTLRDISDHLRGGTPADAAALRGTDLRRLDANLDTLNGIRADVGARTNRLAIAASRLSGLQTNATQLLSDTEDADMAQTITQYTTQQAAYNAALRAGASIVQSSLLDFLH